MADNVVALANTGTGTDVFATDDIAGVNYPRTKITLGADGVNGGDVSASNPMPVTGTVAISGNVEITNDVGNPIPVSAAALPLPTGAATETTLAALNTKTPAVGQAAMAASSPVVIASDQSTVPVNQAGVSATGSITVLNASPTSGAGTAGSAVALSLSGASGWACDLRGTFVATVTFQGTIDGTNWFTIAVLPAGGTVNVASVTTATAVGAWWGNATGLQQVRATATAFTSGSVTVVLRAMQAAGIVTALPSGATTVTVSGTVTSNIGTGSIAAGTNAIGDVGTQYRASATGAASTVSVMSPATPASATIKASAGRLLGWYLQNSSAAIRSVKVFNATAPTLGTTSAAFEIDIPAGGTAQLHFEGGISFATAMTYSVTSAKGLTDNTATGLALNDVSGFFAFA